MMRLKYTDGSPVTDHLNVFQGIINQLAGMGIKFEDEIQGLWLLDVLVTERRGRSQSRGPSNKGNRHSSSSKGKFADVECYHCHKKGHTMKFCRQLKKENKKKNYNNQKNKHKKDDDGDDNTEVNTTTDEFFVCYDYDMVNLANDDSSWILDSGATCHVATQKDYYSSYTPGDFGVVRIGNTGLSRIASIGDICLKFDTGMELVLHNVKHVPDMRLNIISTGLLDEDGYHNSSGNGLWKVTLGSLIVARGKRESKLYMTHPKISKSIVNVVDNDDMTELWHKRLGHISEKGMSILSKKNVLSSVHDIDLKKCSHYLAGKETRLAFKNRSPFRLENMLDLVHSDVCGPMKTKTLSGCSYFVTFTDDHSRKVWVYTLKTKDQVLDVFKQFHALVERQTGKKLKCIQTDNGGEYIGSFDAYCREHGIQHQKTPPKTPQLNGLAEVWSGKDVSYCHLPVFGCKASVHIPKDERSKFDVKGKPSVFLRYGQDEFGYRLYDPVQKKLVRSRDVVFKEDLTLKDGADDVDAQEQPNLDEDVHLELPVHDMPPFLSLMRSTRDHHPSTCYSVHEYVLLTDGEEPELKLPKGKRALKNKWVYKLKTKEHTSRQRYKARLVVKDFSQKRGAKKLHISQEQYIEKVLCRFNMDKAKVVSSPLTTNFKLTDKDCPSSKKNIEKIDRVLYASAVGSLMYAMVCTRPDLAYAVGVVSRFLSNPGGAVSWHSRLQKCVALSTTEAEYMSATEACKELLWLKRFLQELGFKQQRYAVLCDNQTVIHLAMNLMFHKRTKHIDIRCHWMRDAIEDGMFELNKVRKDDNAFDMLTKSVAREKLKVCCSIARMANSSSLAEKGEIC
ncbi:putative RNA-directed DNA polymerase [Tanacetum coccineum]